jgi:AraC family transcriptional regulator of adaptative response/methylated-DNA-[protein]-cysteine methyltransferase
MTGQPLQAKPIARQFVTDQDRWHAIVDRDPDADGSFFYSVRTTGVYCRPGCPAKLPLRKNVRFHATHREAERAGFRPCKRCRPTDKRIEERRSAAVAKACRLIEQAEREPSLEELANYAGMSRYHFHRVFKAHTGVTPKAYAAAQRAQRLRAQLTQKGAITRAIYAAGYNSNGRFYSRGAEHLGMTPAAFRAGGRGVAVQYAVGKCALGSVLVAATERGVCAILLGDNATALVRELRVRFPKAKLAPGDVRFEQWVARVVSFVETPSIGLDLPLDIRGTAFQERVWQALRKIPLGSTATYAEIARRIGRPRSMRAVGTACGANPLALAIPCHRAVRSDGSLSGYRWGVERKRELLRREARANQPKEFA